MMMTINDKSRSFVRPTKSSPRFYNDMEVDLNLVGHMACVWDQNPSLEWFAHQVGGTLLAGSILLKFSAMVVRPLSMNFPPLIGGRGWRTFPPDGSKIYRWIQHLLLTFVIHQLWGLAAMHYLPPCRILAKFFAGYSVINEE